MERVVIIPRRDWYGHLECWMGLIRGDHMDVFVDEVYPDEESESYHRLHFIRKGGEWHYDHERSTRVVSGEYHDCRDLCSVMADAVIANLRRFKEESHGTAEGG